MRIHTKLWKEGKTFFAKIEKWTYEEVWFFEKKFLSENDRESWIENKYKVLKLPAYIPPALRL